MRHLTVSSDRNSKYVNQISIFTFAIWSNNKVVNSFVNNFSYDHFSWKLYIMVKVFIHCTSETDLYPTTLIPQLRVIFNWKLTGTDIQTDKPVC